MTNNNNISNSGKMFCSMTVTYKVVQQKLKAISLFTNDQLLR